MVTVLSVYFITCMEFILKLIRMKLWYLELWPKKKKKSEKLFQLLSSSEFVI